MSLVFVMFYFHPVYVQGRYNQLFDATGCHGWTPVPITTFTIPSSSTFMPLAFYHILSISITPQPIRNSRCTHFIPTSGTPTQVSRRTSRYRLYRIYVISFCKSFLSDKRCIYFFVLNLNVVSLPEKSFPTNSLNM